MRCPLFHNKRHPKEMGAQKIQAFLTQLAVEKNVSPLSRTLALSLKKCLSKPTGAGCDTQRTISHLPRN
jgi:hypothetical protein